MVNSNKPPFLVVGTEVSAKYKGAFCEAKIKKISKTVKCKVQFSNGISTFVTDDAVKGQLKVGATVDIKCGNKKQIIQETIKKIQDCSQYTVAICLKSGKHFAACDTLDQLPLTHPENIGITPVKTTIGQVHRSRNHKNSFGESDKEASAMEEKNIGKVICVESNDKKKVKDNWFPGLIVAPTSQTSLKINVAVDYLVRSFKDGKYYTALKKEMTEFTKEIGAKVENPTLKTAVEKALFFLDKDELPPHWDRNLLFGVDKICVSPDSVAFHNDNSDEESIEEKDHFVAQLFKFMDERGTPLNQAPTINEKDVDLYKLFKVVNDCGGYNKVNKGKLWKFVANKAGHEQQSFFSVKHCYQQYLHSFEDFYRKLGCTMLSHPRGVRSRNKFSRSIIRDVDKLPSTSSMTDTNKCESSKRKNKDMAITKKTVKALKFEEKLLKNNEETSKKDDKKKEDNANSISCNKLSIKRDLDISEVKTSAKNSITKKKLKETLKKEKKKETDSDKVDVDQIIKNKKVEKKIFTRNLFGKSVQKTTNKEKVVKVKSANTGLSGMRKIRAIKGQIKTFVKEMIPLKKSKRGNSNTQQESSSKGNLIEEVPKLTKKTKEDLPTKSRRLSVLNDLAGSVSVAQLTQPGLLKNLVKTKKVDGFEKKKTLRKKKNDKQEKAASNIINPITIIENVPFDKNLPVIVGDNLVVYYGDKETTTYDAKVVNVYDIEGEMKYYVHYKGWNSRYDEWIDVTRIAYKKKEPEPKPELDIDADFSKNNHSEQKNLDPKKVPSTPNKTRSITPISPIPSNSKIKKSPYSSTRPTRSCTLIDRPLLDIDNSDSEEEYTAIVGPSKQYSKKNIIKSEPLDTDNQKKTLYPKTYLSKEVLMQRSALRKSKSCEFNVHSIKSEEVKVCEPTTLKSAYNFDYVMQLPNDSKLNEANENLEAPNESKIDNCIQIEPKIAPDHYLSPREKSEKHYLEHNMSESSKSENEEIRINSKPLTIPTMSEISSIVFYSSSYEGEEQNQLKKVSNVVSSPLDNKSNKSKISGTDFDLNKIRSEMKGLIPTSTNSNDIIQNTESFILDQQIENKISEINEPITDDVYEFKESEVCNFNTITSVTEEKICRSIIHDSPKLFNFEKPDEPAKVIYSPAPEAEEIVEQNGSIIPFVPNSHGFYSSENNVKLKDNKNLNIINIIEDPIMKNFSANESYESQTLMISDVTDVTSNIKKIQQHFQDENNVPDLKYEVLDLCMKPPESPSANIFSMPEQNEFTNMIIEEDDDDDDDDDDESKLVIVENDKLETDYQVDTDTVISEEHYSSNGQTDKNITVQSLPPLPPSIHSTIELECKNTDNIDENTKSGFNSNSKLPTIKNNEMIESTTKLINEPLVNDNVKIYDIKVHNFKDKSEKVKTMALPELQCTEELVDEDTLNNALTTEYSCKNTEYDINKPSTSKSSYYECSLPSTSKSSYYECSLPSTSKSSYYECSLPSTSKCFYGAESNISRVLFCEETIPGSPTGMLEERYDQEERRKALQGLSEETEAASAIYTMNQSFCIPKITLMGATEEEMEKYSNFFQKNGAILDQEHLQFLAEISRRNLDINKPSVTEPLERERETKVEIKPPEKLQSKRKVSSHEKPPKRNKLSTTTAPIPSGSHVEKPKIDYSIPPIWKGKPMFVYIPGMTSKQRQALILEAIDTLRVDYADELVAQKNDRDRWEKEKKKNEKKEKKMEKEKKKIEKEKKKMEKEKKKMEKEKKKIEKAAKDASMDPSQAANGSIALLNKI